MLCSHCGPKSPADFSVQDRKDFFRSSGRNVQCLACKVAGRKVWDGKHRKTAEHTCDSCGREVDAALFRKQQGQRLTTCRDCEPIPCVGCKQTKPQEQFQAQGRHHFFIHAQPALRSACHDIGRTPRNAKLYTCVGFGGCFRDWGHARFNANHVREFERGVRAELLCSACDARASAKDKRLMKLWRASRQKKCPCGLPIHAEKCFMRWDGVNARPHLGMDKLNRAEYQWLRRRGKI